MFASIVRCAARPSAGPVRRGAKGAALNSLMRNVRQRSNLADVLKAEVQEERLIAFDQDVAAMVGGLKEKGITIKDEPGVALVRLFGPGVGDEKVMVEFNCDVSGEDDDGWADDFEDESDEDDSHQAQARESEGDETEDDDVDDSPGYRFTATITKGAKKMVCAGTATNEIALHGVRISPANTDWDPSQYRGPVFHELDPDLQEAMLEYLRERDINNDLAAFICMYADQKEQTEYVNWLEEVHKFVK